MSGAPSRWLPYLTPNGPVPWRSLRGRLGGRCVCGVWFWVEGGGNLEVGNIVFQWFVQLVFRWFHVDFESSDLFCMSMGTDFFRGVSKLLTLKVWTHFCICSHKDLRHFHLSTLSKFESCCTTLSTPYLNINKLYSTLWLHVNSNHL